jgi:hypothetical protein
LNDLETAREILVYVPAGVRSEIPATGSSVLRELDGEAGLTPLHLAAYSGDENVVRLLLNSPGVSVDQPSSQNVKQFTYFQPSVPNKIL